MAIDKDVAIEGTRRNRKWWSQGEGFALFLALGEIAKPETWAKQMFGNQLEPVTDLINIKLK